MITRTQLLKKVREAKAKRPKWMRKLSNKEIIYMKEELDMSNPTLHAFKLTREKQIRYNIDCPIFKRIAIKIGLEREKD
jgi:hypothetical protein